MIITPQSPPAPLVISRTAERIARQLQARLDGHGASGEAFVVSIYGEWGVGKTHCLKDIDRLFAIQLNGDLHQLAQREIAQVVVPVFFDPWQYEHEDHLVIPLLKTIELHLKRTDDQLTRLMEASHKAEEFTQRAVALGSSLRKAGSVVGDAAVALASGFKFKLAPLKELIGIEVDFSPKDALDVGRKAAEQRKAQAAEKAELPRYRRLLAKPNANYQRLAQRESLYFDMRSSLQALTSDAQKPALRVVVLIDDLDRCLPEKAIQVLESVKLFLNVPGFSFVLAVDDEVVERGIAHRYSAYKSDGEGSNHLPISGAEYLEKIVHLPVHLQRWTPDEARQFLRDTYPALFAPPPPKPQASEKSSTRMDSISNDDAPTNAQASAQASRSTELLEFVVKAVPLVPRKLIRLAEGLAFLYEHMSSLGAHALWHPIHAARVVALQQLYPALFRHLRLGITRYWRLFDLDRNDFGEPQVRDGESLHQLRQQHKERMKAGNPALTAKRTNTLREELTLLELVQDAGQQRGSPDPLLLFPPDLAEDQRQPDSIRSGMRFHEFAQLYIHGLALPEAPGSKPAVPATAAAAIAQVADAGRLIAALTDPDPLSRREYLQAQGLQGRLPDVVFDALLARLRDERQPEKFTTSLEWLQDIAAVTSPEQLLQLYQELNVLEAYAPPKEQSHA